MKDTQHTIQDLIEYLPYVYRTKEVVEICKGLTISLREFFGDLEISEDEYCAKTSTEKIREWAKIVGIEIDESAYIEEQRGQILAAMKTNDITTTKLIQMIVESYSNALCEVREIYDEYCFVIKFIHKIGVPKKIDVIRRSIDRVKPAHLNYRFEYKYRTWGNLKNYNITYGSAKAHMINCKTLREGDITVLYPQGALIWK